MTQSSADYFRGTQLRPGVDVTGSRAAMRAVTLGWLRRNPGIHSIVHVKDAVNCGDSQLFASLLDELASADLVQVTFKSDFWGYGHVAIRLDEWLRHAEAEQATAKGA